MASGVHLDEQLLNASMATSSPLAADNFCDVFVQRPESYPAIDPAIQLSSGPAVQSSSHPLEQPPIRPLTRPSSHPAGHPSTHIPHEMALYLPLTPAQGKLLIFLLEEGSGATSVPIISRSTGIPPGTIKDGLRTLVNHGYILRKWRIATHYFHGFGYLLNTQACIEYTGNVRGTSHPTAQPPSHPLPSRSLRASNHPAIRPSAPLSSSSYNLETTTKPKVEINFDHPELEFWVKRGLETKTVKGWMAEFNITTDQMLQSLKHAAFDIPIQEEKQAKQIDPFNWFYGGLRRFGSYRRPAGYKPLEQILLDEARMEREERERLAQELAEERQRGERAAQELKFQQIMANPTGAEYLKLKEQVTNSNSLPLTGKMLESALREAFLSSDQIGL